MKMLRKFRVVGLVMAILLSVAASLAQAQTAGTVKVAPEVMEKRCIKKVSPIYPPPYARSARLSGVVIVHVLITKTGSVTPLEIVSGHALFQEAAKSTVRKWQYKPYMLNGQPVAVTTDVSVVFKLDAEEGEVTHPNL